MPFLRQWFVPDERRFSWVYQIGHKVHGLVSARERATSSSWEIDYLLLSENKEEVSQDLLETLTFHAAKRGVRKIFLRSYATNPFLPFLQKSDFKIYLNEHLFHLDGIVANAFTRSYRDNFTGRSRKPDDYYHLYEMMYRGQPTLVKSVESISLQEWQNTREKGCPWEKDILLEREGNIQGWLRVRKGINWGHFKVMACVTDIKTVEQIFLHALHLLRNKQHIYCTVRDYQEEVRKMLREKSFEKKEDFSLAFKEISITEKKSVLISQQA